MKAITKTLRKAVWAQTLVMTALIPGLVLWPMPVRSNPTGATVKHGAVEIDDLTPGHLKIHQASNKAIINWESFSINGGEITQFIQPGKDAVALNRVVSGNPSALMGTLMANGGVILVNPNGILVGAGGVVDIGGLGVLSTLDIDDADFLNGGPMNFKGNSSAGVTNLGTITSRGGDVVLLGNFVDNQGTVGAPDGTVAFGAGGEFIVDTIGESRISVIGPGPGGQKGVSNSGTVNAASVEFKAHGNVYAMAIENTGIVRANGVSRRGGRILLSASGDGTVGGNITNSGTLRARNADGSGGEILIDAGVGGQIDNIDGRIDADGDAGTDGGSITMLGDVINIVGNSRVSADGDNGGFVQIGSQESTTAVTVGAGSTVSANGVAGDGGVVQVLGTSSSVLTIDGNLSANGTGSGGVVTLTGGTVNQGATSVISADGAVRGGAVNVSGAGSVNTLGTIQATGANSVGGQVLLNGGAVSVDGGVNAGGLTEGGLIQIDSMGETRVDGDLDASSSSGIGGRIDATGQGVNIGGGATINASGAIGGGAVNLGGGIQGNNAEVRNSQSTVVEEGASINVDALVIGDGGSVAVWSDGGTIFHGEISAQAHGSVGNGGFVEVSGRNGLEVGGLVSTQSANGETGTFLIDPIDVTIGPGAGTISDLALVNFVQANNVIVHTSGSDSGIGNITVAPGANVIYDSPNSLTFLAHGNVIIDGDIKNIGTTDVSNTGHINLVAGWDGTLPGLSNLSGHPQTLNDLVSSADFINPDGTPLATPGRFGEWGAVGSSVFLNSAGLEPVEVGSARGETNVFADVVELKTGLSDGRFTQIGYRRVADSRATMGFFADPTQQIVDGDINVAGKTAVILRNPDQFSTTDGIKVRNATYAMIGHGGQRNNNNNIDNRGVDATGAFDYGSDSGVVGVADGDNSGDITVYAGQALVMVSGRADATTQIGHGGLHNAAFNSGNTPFTGGAIFASMSGDINVTAGQIEMEAGLYDDAYTMIGHGGRTIRGEMSGDVTVTTTVGGIIGTAAPVLGHTNSGNNRDRSFVQIGHGGSNVYHGSALPARTLPVGTGGTTSYAGDGIAINPLTGLPYGHNGDLTVTSNGGIQFTATGNSAHAMIGHGGEVVHGDHRGDISVTADNGDIIFDRIAIQVDDAGIDVRARGNGAFVQIGHGGRRSSGGNTGDIAVTASGNIEFYAGRNEAFAQIGHGGRGITDVSTVGGVTNQRNNQYANGSHSGDITVTAGGDVIFRAGFGTGGTAYAMIGNGGYRQYADILENEAFAGVTPFGGGASTILTDVDGNPVLDGNGLFQLVADETQQGHNGDITVTAGGKVDFRAGQVDGEILRGQEPFGVEMNRNQNYVMIGNGGDEAWGDHWGNVTITAGTDLIMEARGGWDAVSYEGVNGGPFDPALVSVGNRGTPRLATNEDNATTGIRNFAMIGNGGYNAHHRVNSQPAHRDGTGKRAEGMGTWGPSDITITTGGDVIIRAASKDSVGTGLMQRAILARDNSNAPSFLDGYYYVDVFGNPIELSATVGATQAYPDVVNRAAPLMVPVLDGSGNPVLDVNGDPVMQVSLGRTDMQITGYRLTSDGTAANRDRLIMIDGHGFGGGSISSIHGSGTANNQLNEIVYFSGAGAAELGLIEGQAYRIVDVRVNEGDFRIQPVKLLANGLQDTSLTTNPVVAIAAAPVGELLMHQSWNGWKSGPPVMGAQDSFAQIGNGGRSTSHDGGAIPGVGGAADGLGHRGDIFIDAGGGVTLDAGDFDVAVAFEQGVPIQRVAHDGSPLLLPLLGADGKPVLDGVGNAQLTPVDDIMVGPIRNRNFFQSGNGAVDGTMRPYVEQIIATNGVEGDPRGQQNFSLHGRNYAQIGHGGWTARGDHMGSIIINAGSDANGVGLRVHAGEGTQDYAQVGHGGYDSDGYDPQGGRNSNNNRLGDIGSRGDIRVNVAGYVLVQGGGVDGNIAGRPGDFTTTIASLGTNRPNERTVITRDEGSISYAMIGNGGFSNGGNHTGDITVQSTAGNVDVLAGNNARYSFAQIGNGGAAARGQFSGDIQVVADGDINLVGGASFRDFEASEAELSIPGLDNTGHISLGVANYSMIGNGGWDTDPQGGNLNLAAGTLGHTGDIEVISVNGNITLKGGGTDESAAISINDDSLNRGNSAHIGNGGNFTDGDHGGEIRVAAGGDLIMEGAAGSRDSYTMIGHGGHQIDGNLSGTIEVAVGGDLVMNRGSDTDTGVGTSPQWIIRESRLVGATTVAHQIRWSTELENTVPFVVAGATGTNTISSATLNGLADGDRVVFTAGAGGGLSNGTTYYVVNSTASGFQLATTPGGPALAISGNFTNASIQRQIEATGFDVTNLISTGTREHGLVSGDRVDVIDPVGGSGLTAGTYFVRDVTSTSFRLSATQDGAPVDFTSDLSSAVIQRVGSTQLLRQPRDGTETFNNWVKIGHGDHLLRQRSSGNGSRNGDILVSVGNDVVLSDPGTRPFDDAAYTRLYRDQVLIGHIDPLRSGSSAFRSTEGNTFIAASRVNPFDTGTGALRIGSDAVLTSAGGGFFGELRLYLPSFAQNFIMDGAFMNNNEYTRTPVPDGTRADELIGTDHLQDVGAFGEPTGTFVPEGAYSPSGFGQYNIYYGTLEPVIPPQPPVTPPVGTEELLPVVEEVLLPVEVITPFDYFSFLFLDKYDTFDRDDQYLEGMGYYSLYEIFGDLEGFGESYNFNFDTNEYSSFRLFGVPSGPDAPRRTPKPVTPLP